MNLPRHTTPHTHSTTALVVAFCVVCACLYTPSRLTYAQDPTDTQPPTSSPPSREDVYDLLNRARQAYLNGLYTNVIELLEPALQGSPPPIKSLSVLDQIEVYRLLGLSLSLDPTRRDDARKVFTQALSLDPSFQLIEGIHPEAAVSLVEDIRQELGNTTQNPNNNGLETVYIEREVVKNQKFLVLMPFGLGQYQNDDMFWFVFFLSAEALSLATNITCFTWAESLRSPDGLYTPSNRTKAQTLQTVQFTAFYAFLAFYSTSVVHAWWNYTPYTTSIKILDSPPPELSRAPSRDRWTVSIEQAPRILPDAHIQLPELDGTPSEDGWMMRFSLGF